jgi:hypothetical protein
MNTGTSYTSIKRAQRARSCSRQVLLSPSVASSSGDLIIDVQDDVLLLQFVDNNSQFDGPASRLPNYYIGLYFKETIEEFSLL